MTEEELDKAFPKLREYAIAVAINACVRAGAVNAAHALSKHITRLQMEITLLRQEAEKRTGAATAGEE